MQTFPVRASSKKVLIVYSKVQRSQGLAFLQEQSLEPQVNHR